MNAILTDFMAVWQSELANTVGSEMQRPIEPSHFEYTNVESFGALLDLEYFSLLLFKKACPGPSWWRSNFFTNDMHMVVTVSHTVVDVFIDVFWMSLFQAWYQRALMDYCDI